MFNNTFLDILFGSWSLRFNVVKSNLCERFQIIIFIIFAPKIFDSRNHIRSLRNIIITAPTHQCAEMFEQYAVTLKNITSTK